MSFSSPTSQLDVDPRPGQVPILHAGGAADAPRWAGEYRDAVRAVATNHGCVLVRGLALRDAAEAGAVFRQLANGLMSEKEAFAPRQAYPGGAYSSTTWPPNQQMCMHQELSYRLEFPGLMMFACLTAPAAGGVTGVADSPEVLGALPAELAGRFERLGWMLIRTTTRTSGLPAPRRSEPRTATPSNATAGPTRSSSNGSPTAGCAPGSAAAP